MLVQTLEKQKTPKLYLFNYISRHIESKYFKKDKLSQIVKIQ